MFEKMKSKQIVNDLFSLISLCAKDIPVYNENRDFIEFEFAFYCYFINDYKIYNKEDPKIRSLICDLFIEKLNSDRVGNFTGNELNEIFNNHIMAYFAFMKEAKTIGNFIARCADYMNVMITISIKDNGYANGNLNDLAEMKKVSSVDIFTELIKMSLTVNTSMIL